jgi:hypothetical protein
MSPDIRSSYSGSGIDRFGDYEFVDVQILEIRPA